MIYWGDKLPDLEEDLLNMQKSMEKNIIFTVVAIGAGTKSINNEKRVQEKAEEIQGQTKESLNTISSSLESSLKGKFGKQAKKLLKENAKKFK